MNGLVGDIQGFTRDRWLWPILLFPLLGALTNGLLGRQLQRRWGARANHVIALGAMVGATAAALAAVARLVALPADLRFLWNPCWNLLAVGTVHADLAFALDPLSAVLILVITLVGTSIHLYATAYMRGDPSLWRFFSYLNLFVFSMLLLVLGDGFFTLFFGWEGVGLCSYLLIGFWYSNPANGKAATKAFLTNRVGDWGFLCGLLFLFWGLAGAFSSPRVATSPADRATIAVTDGHGKPAQIPWGATLSFRELRNELTVAQGEGHPLVAESLARQTVWGIPLLLLVGGGLFLGVSAKSAQIPLHVWLPDAMAGPTPVSALIHAATMVTAGVYLVARLSFLFVLTPWVMTVIASVGVMTALAAALVACFQYDLKKVLAYSTISQLGVMILGVGVGAFGAGVFHLVTHACFKACLFLAAGSVIHGLHHLAKNQPPPAAQKFDPRLSPARNDPQDMRNMGGLGPLMPRTHLAYLLGCVAIAGFPLASGFYSKDLILWQTFNQRIGLLPGHLLFSLGLLTSGLTSFYMFRSYYLTFAGRSHPEPSATHVHESSPAMTASMLVLAGGAVVAGPILGWPEAWGGRPFLERFLAPVFAPSLAAAGDALSFGGSRGLERAMQAVGVAVALIGWVVARRLYRDLSRSAVILEGARLRWDGIHRFLFGGGFVDEVYREVAVYPVQDFSRGAAWMDRHVVDGLVRGVAWFIRFGATASAGFDRKVVDGMVGLLAKGTIRGGRRLARLQTGRINNYVLGITFGVISLVILAWFLR